MKMLGICGSSGAGKTTLIEGLIAALKLQPQRVSVIKNHAHQGFAIDTPDTDTLPVPTLRAVFKLDSATALAGYLLREGDRYELHGERHG